MAINPQPNENDDVILISDGQAAEVLIIPSDSSDEEDITAVSSSSESEQDDDSTKDEEIVMQEIVDTLPTNVPADTVALITAILPTPAPNVEDIINPINIADNSATPDANISSLGLIADYGQSSDSESEEDVQTVPENASADSIQQEAIKKLDQFIQDGTYRIISDSSEESDAER